MTQPDSAGFDDGTIVTDDVVASAIDDAAVSFAATDAEPAGGSGAPGSARVVVAAAAASGAQTLQRLLERVPDAAAGPARPRSGSAFRVIDSLGASTDALDVIANPLAVSPSYLGVYHINVGAGRFALRLAASADLATWRKIADLDATGGAMGTLRALPGGGFLLAYEAQRATAPNGKTATNVRLRHYRDAGAMLAGVATEERTLPRRLSRTNEGTPNFRAVDWRGSLATSRITVGFHYLDYGPPHDRRKLAVDREAYGTLDGGRWSVVVDAGLDSALSQMGFHGNHGGRRQFQFPKGGKTWRVYEAQRLVNVTGSWRVLLYDVAARRLRLLHVRTPRASTSLANPTVGVLPSPSPAGGNALVVTMFVFGAGSGAGESGELVYYHDL